jgi:carboxyl-terminal processing protease
MLRNLQGNKEAAKDLETPSSFREKYSTKGNANFAQRKAPSMYQLHRIYLRETLMPVLALLGAFVLSVYDCSAQSIDYEKRWQEEQRERNDVRMLLSNAKVTADEFRAGMKRLEALLHSVSAISESDYESNGWAKILYLQRNDLMIDLVDFYASQGDTHMAELYTEQLRESLESKRSPCSEDPGGKKLFGWYAERLAGNVHVRSLLPNTAIEDVVQSFRNRDRFWYFRSYPYATSDSNDVSVEDRVAGLSQLWAEGKYSFANFDLVPGLDWHAHYSQFIPKVIAAKDRYEYYRVLRRFMTRLKDSHTDINLPLSLRQSVESMPALRTEWIDGRVYVSELLSPELAKGGLAAGDEILEIDGVPVMEYADAHWSDQVSCSTPQDRLVRIYSYYLLRGPLDVPIQLHIRKSDSSTPTVSVSRKVKGSAKLNRFDFRKTSDNIAIVSVATFGDASVVDAFIQNWGSISECKAIILDLRSNDGGDSSNGDRLLSMLIDKAVVPTRWSTIEVRAAHRAWEQSPTVLSELSETIEPFKEPFAGPVCVLTSAKTFSAGEDFVAAFLTAKRGPVIGQTTGGSTGQPISCQLPGGGSARFCAKRDRFVDGREFVGKGIEPNIVVADHVSRIRDGIDPVLQRAIQEMNKPFSMAEK